MKKLATLFAVILIAINALAQSPEMMSYQCVIRNSGGVLVTNQSVGIRISILHSTATGTVVYQETYNPKPQTNANGLVSLEIGSGVVSVGTFSAIDWASGPYFLKTETDPAGGTNYTITGTTQLLSVPYAIYAKTAESVTGHYIGENYGGGIVFYVSDNGQHGLIVAPVTGGLMRWYAGTSTHTMALGNGIGAGKTNTALIIASQGYGDGNTYAARYCNEYSVTVGDVIYADWYLPSKFELTLMYRQKALLGIGNGAFYWSSNENSAFISEAFEIGFVNGGFDTPGKSETETVRPIRMF
jgi:hypothetical protein